MRLFTGLAIPPEAIAALEVASAPLRGLTGLRWSPPDKLHITLTFIGEWPEERLSEIKSALAAVKEPGPLAISLRGLGWLPNPRFPRTLYTGVVAGPELGVLAAASNKALAAAGVTIEDRIYRPHVTLARVKGRMKPGSVELGAGPTTAFETSAFFLYLSSGGKYTKLEEFRLVSSDSVTSL
jgi:2'-5' RNA ligase